LSSRFGVHASQIHASLLADLASDADNAQRGY
jgi:hypothetical protein